MPTDEYMFLKSADLWRREGIISGFAGINNLVQQAVEQSQHHDDEVIGRCLDQHLAVMSDEVKAWLNEPVEKVSQHVAVLLRHRTRQLQTWPSRITHTLSHTHAHTRTHARTHAHTHTFIKDRTQSKYNFMQPFTAKSAKSANDSAMIRLFCPKAL